MAVILRLTRAGRHKVPYYRIVAADKEMPRDGRYLELIGTYNPLTDPSTITLKEDRVKYWIGVGASTSGTVASIINRKIPGFLTELEEKRLAKKIGRRKARKAKTKSAGKNTKRSSKSA